MLIERAKSKVQLTPNDIKKFIFKALKKEPLPLIRTLIKQIIMYDDKIEIYYNYTEKKGPGDLDHQAFCFYREEFNIQPEDYGLNYNAAGYKLILETYF